LVVGIRLAGTGTESLQELKMVQKLSSDCAWFRIYPLADVGSRLYPA